MGFRAISLPALLVTLCLHALLLKSRALLLLSLHKIHAGTHIEHKSDLTYALYIDKKNSLKHLFMLTKSRRPSNPCAIL